MHLEVWSLLTPDALVIRFLRSELNWIGPLLLTLPAFAYFLHWQQRNLQSLVIVFLDDLAKDTRLVKMPERPPENKPVRVRPEPGAGMAS